MILRLPIHIKLMDTDGRLVKSINSSKKSRVRSNLQGFPRAGWSYGVCRIYYNKPHDFWNEFYFLNPHQLDEGLTLNTEKALIDFLKDVIPKQYLEKRQLSVAQRQALTQARSNSPIRRGV